MTAKLDRFAPPTDQPSQAARLDQFESEFIADCGGVGILLAEAIVDDDEGEALCEHFAALIQATLRSSDQSVREKALEWVRPKAREYAARALRLAIAEEGL